MPGSPEAARRFWRLFYLKALYCSNAVDEPKSQREYPAQSSRSCTEYRDFYVFGCPNPSSFATVAFPANTVLL
jgi:hypothetical protein